MYVFNKILIIFFTILACFSLWTQCSSAHTFKTGQGQQRNYKAHLGVQKWVFGHLLRTHWGAGFWFSVTWQSGGKADVEQPFACARKSSRQQSGELLGQSICMAKWWWPGCLPHLGHSSGQTDSLLLLLQPARWQFWQGQPSQGGLVRPLPASGCTGAAALLSPCSPRQPRSSCLLFGTVPGPSFARQPCKALSASAWHHIFARNS